MNRRIAAHIAITCAAVVVAAASFAAITPAARADCLVQREPVPPTHGLDGDPPLCEGAVQLAASNQDPRVGEVITVTARSQFQCPRLLESSAPLFLVGGVPEWALPSVRTALGEIAVAVGDAGDAPFAYRMVGDDDAPIVWTSTPTGRRAVAKALNLDGSRPAGTARQWSSALDAAGRALIALSPRYRPLLVVVDGIPTESGANGVVDGVFRALRTTSDMAGHAIVIDASDTGWLQERERDEPSLRGNALFVFDADRDPIWVSFIVGQLMRAFQAPIQERIASLHIDSSDMQMLAAQPEPLRARDNNILWMEAINAHENSFAATVQFRVVGEPGLTSIDFSAAAGRGMSSTDNFFSDPLSICIEPAGSERSECAELVKEPPGSFIEPSPTPTPSHTPSPTRTRTPTRTPRGAATVPPAPATTVPVRQLFVPRLDRP